MCETKTANVHCFEKAGLGFAPFKLVGIETTADRQLINTQRASNGMMFTTNMCGGTCDYCGMAIMDVYKIKSADGKTFKVGCDCVLKTGDAGIINTVKKAANVLATAKRHSREAAKIAAGLKLIADNEWLLSKIPNPVELRAKIG